MAGEQDPKRQGGKPGEDTSGLIDLLELAATEKKTQTGKHPVVGRTPQGGTRAVSDTGRRSVIRVATPPTGESRVPTPTGTSGRNGAVVRTMTPPTGTPVVPPVPVAPPAPAAARSKLPLVIGGVVAAAAVVGGYLVFARPSAPVAPVAAPVAAEQPVAAKPTEAARPAEPAKPAEAKPAAPEAKPAEAAAAAAVKVEAKERPSHEGSKKEARVAKAEPKAEASKASEKAEPKETKAAAGDDPFPAKGKDKPAPKAEEPPKTEAARLAGEAVTKEKKDSKGKGSDELSNVLSASGEEKEKPAAAKAEDALPEKLSQGDLKKGMGPVAKKAADCYEKYQVPGLAKVQLTIEATGKVSGAKVLGSYDGTPTGQCLLDAINKASFPKTRSPLSLTYPFMLR